MSILIRSMRFCLACLLLSSTTPGMAQERMPNIIIIMADDMGYGDPGCYNPESKIPTPNMDQLSEEGVLFTDAHSPSSVCTPSRYGLLTGRYCWRTRLKNGVLWSGYDDPLIPTDRETIASMLKEKGYRTGVVGKWHLGINFLKNNEMTFVDPKKSPSSGKDGSRDVNFKRPSFNGPNYVGFDYSFLSAAGHNMEPFCFIENDRSVGIPTKWREAKAPIEEGLSGKEVHEGWMIEDWDDRDIGTAFTQKSINFIRNAHEKDKPFFLYLATTSPHRPCNPPAFAKNKSDAGDRGDMVFEFDWTVGQIMRTLDSLNISENTLLIVTSDNGATETSDNGEDYGHKSCGALKGFKASTYEGGHRVPFIARWPEVLSAGSLHEGLVCLTDMFATVAGLIGHEMADGSGEDSFDIMPQILENREVRTSIIHDSYSGNLAVRMDGWKLHMRDNELNALYHLADDPYEEVDLLDSNQEKAMELFEALNKYKWQGYSNR